MPAFRYFVPPKSIDTALRDLKTKPPEYWTRRGEKHALALFRYAYDTVPAYQKFLKTHGIDGTKIKTVHDFKTLPTTDKQTYLRAYPYEDLFPDRDLSRVTTISATSGSTGEPFYFPRGEEQDAQYEYIAELFLKNQFEIDKKSTLGIIGFGLGIWIGGLFTYKVMNKIAAKGYRLSLAPVGPNIPLFLKTLKKFGHLYDQILLMGYPPFVKDIVDEAEAHGVMWRDYNIKIVMATEAFSDNYRWYVKEKAGIKNAFADTLNIYGSVELGTMGHETPISSLIRTIGLVRSSALEDVFSWKNRLPTLAQYHPSVTYFEEKDGEVIASGFGSSFPLIRYRLPDRGGVFSFDDMVLRLRERGIDLIKKAKQEGIADTIWRLPFVYVYDREDNMLVVRGVNIYREHIEQALTDRNLLHAVTGKFSMQKKEDARMNEYFEIHIELLKGVASSVVLKKRVQDLIVQTLCQINSEYEDQYRSVPVVMTPPIILHSYHEATYFAPGGKQKWVKK